MLAELEAGNGKLILCSPPDEILTVVAPLIQVMIKDAVAQIPDSQVITPQLERIPSALARWEVACPAGSGWRAWGCGSARSCRCFA